MTTRPRPGDRVRWADRDWLVGGDADGRVVLYGDDAVTAYVPPDLIERPPAAPTPADLLAAGERFLVEDPDGAPYPDHAQDVIWQLVDALRAADAHRAPPVVCDECGAADHNGNWHRRYVPADAEAEAEWMRCMDDGGPAGSLYSITSGRVYRVVGRTDDGLLRVITNDGAVRHYGTWRFIPASADEATAAERMAFGWPW